jgi:cytochrome c oxidase cbb3-type subunit IV
MIMTHQELSALAGTWGLVLFCVLFLIAVGYALWPSNRETFEHLARLPLDDDHQGGAQ